MLNNLPRVLSYISFIAATAVITPSSAAQPPAQPAAKPGAQPAVQTPAPSSDERLPRFEERLIRLEERVSLSGERSELAVKQIQFVGIVVGLIGALAGFVLVYYSIRDYRVRLKQENRQKGIDDIVTDMMKLQRFSAKQQVEFGQLQLNQQRGIDEIAMDMMKLQRSSAKQQVEFGQRELKQDTASQQFQAVEKVNEVIEVVRQTLDFRLQQEAKVAEAMLEIENMKRDRERAKQHKLQQAIAIADHFKSMSRMQFATLTDEQYKRGLRLEGLVNDLVADLDEFKADQGFEVAGTLLYTCGVIAYYDNDVIEARDFLDRAAACRAADHDGELKTNDRYRYRFAFTHYFRALIHKNWGDLHQALHEIEQSARVLEGQPGEFLTPVTKAEIMSYFDGNEKRCRKELEELVKQIDDLEAGLKIKGEALNANQIRLRNRMLVLSGNTFFQQKDFKEALPLYIKAMGINPSDYYALASAAQCEAELGDVATAKTHYEQSLDAIERSGDFRRKRERITRAVIATIAANAAKGCGDNDRRQQYSREARELLSGNLMVDGMSPKFFSPATKRLVNATELLKEVT